MAGGSLGRRSVPWCTVFLVVGAIACHAIVLIGNLKTASAFSAMGSSSAGWSRVGLGLSRSFNIELDHLMDTLSTQLVDNLQRMTVVQSTIDVVVSLIGNSTDAAVASTADNQTALLQLSQSPGGDLQTLLAPMIIDSVRHGLEVAVNEITDLLHDLMARLRPVLMHIGEMLNRFSDSVMNGMDTFSTSLDRVQAIFDQVMSQLHGGGEGSEQMLEQTFNLFDVSNTGFVTQEDLENVARLYGITALEGTKPAELIARYDLDHTRDLDRAEMAYMVEDDTVPMIMSVVLRQYARRLAEVGGNVAGARMRGDVAVNVVRYFQLVCANNATKVQWVSQALSNGSLPMAFTSAIFAQLCLQEDSPSTLTTADIGAMVTSAMYGFHPDYTLQAVDLMSNATYWEGNGFNPLDQPACMQRVTQWVVQAQTSSATSTNQALLRAGGSSLLQAADLSNMATEVLMEMPMAARRLAEQNMRAHLTAKRRAFAARKAELYHSHASKALMRHLLGDAPAASHQLNPNVAQAINSGQPAAEVTLQWAQWLRNNASMNSAYKQDLCFSYSGQSTTTTDSFATQIQTMITRIRSFTQMMQEYSTPAGIARLEQQVTSFEEHALDDVVRVIEHQIQSIVGRTAPQIEEALDNSIHQATDSIADTLAGAISGPIVIGLEDPIADILGGALGSEAVGRTVADQLVPGLGTLLANATSDALSDQIDNALDQLIHQALEAASNAVNSTLGEVAAPSLLALQVQQAPQGLSQAWTNIVNMLRSLTNLVPTANMALRQAREPVSSAASQLDSIFVVFEVRGPAIFDTIAYYYSVLWTLYFILLTPLTLGVLYYGFWSGGFFGGPAPIDKDEDEEAPPRTWREKCGVCVRSCGICGMRYHDTQFCFWSAIIVMQVVVLVVFLVAVALCVLAGVKAFVLTGCSQVYMLNDATICTSTMNMLRNFLGTFFVSDAVEALENVCPTNNLMTCQLINAKMKSSVIMTTVFSLLGALFSLQMLIESAVLHEQARYRRMYNEKVLDDETPAEKGEVAPTTMI
mmetsp:Transcript_32146/g.84904  ORF Transcript_32146/g.84904 Transcript_32146/m.84904 type:complete len:1034 (+) Transcript_32146:79-3180(+)